MNYFRICCVASALYDDYSLLLDDERLSIVQHLFISLEGVKFSIPTPEPPVEPISSPPTVAAASNVASATTAAPLSAQAKPKEDSLISRLKTSIIASTKETDQSMTSSTEYYPSVQPESIQVLPPASAEGTLHPFFPFLVSEI